MKGLAVNVKCPTFGYCQERLRNRAHEESVVALGRAHDEAEGGGRPNADKLSRSDHVNPSKTGTHRRGVKLEATPPRSAHQRHDKARNRDERRTVAPTGKPPRATVVTSPWASTAHAPAKTPRCSPA
jgi:hypothetical protein